MPRFRQDFTLFPRSIPGKKIWYYRTYSPDGVRSVPRSTGIPCDDSTPGKKNTSRAKAVKYCNGLMTSGRLYQGSCVNFAAYSRGWFSPGCKWLADRLAAGVPGRPGISPSYIKSLEMCLRLYLVPFFGEKTVETIRPSTIKAFRLWLQTEKGLSNRTINVACDTLRVMTEWMLAEGVILLDPFRSVQRFAIEKNTRRGFYIEEATAIFSSPWPAPLPRLFSLVAAITGLRLSEIRAIRAETLFPTFIDVKDQYTGSISPLKTHESRKVPIPGGLYSILKPYAASPFVFSLPGSAAPMCRNAIIEPLEKVMLGSGPVPVVPKVDGLCFHSWRHFANTWFLSCGVDPHKVRAVIGHSEGKGSMTAAYTDWRPEMFPEVYAAQEKLFLLLTEKLDGLDRRDSED